MCELFIQAKDSLAARGLRANSNRGGGCVKDSEGNLVLVKNQDESGYISSLANSKEHNVPVGVIIG